MSLLDQKLNRPDLGLLILRVVFGSLLFVGGVQNLLGGKEMLEAVGKPVEIFGIAQGRVFWGLLAALIETVGGIFIVFGFMFRWAMLVAFCYMGLVTTWMWQDPENHRYMVAMDHPAVWRNLMVRISTLGGPMSFATVFLALLFTGPGRFAIKRTGARAPVRHGD